MLTQRLTRASRHLKGLFFAANPGERYVLANDCVSLARILDVCSDFLLRGFMDHDLGKKGATFKSFFTAAGITALRYDGTHGKNTETNEKIIWWSFGPPRFHTPADQLTRSFASLVSAFKINAITKGLPLLSRPVVRGDGGRPSHVEVDIFDPADLHHFDIDLLDLGVLETFVARVVWQSMAVIVMHWVDLEEIFVEV